MAISVRGVNSSKVLPLQPNSYIILPPLNKLPPHSYINLPPIDNLSPHSYIKMGGIQGGHSTREKRAMIPVESSSMRHLLLQLNPQWFILLGLQPLLFLRPQSQVILDPLVLLLSGGPSSAAFAALSLNHPWNWDKVVANWSNNRDPKANPGRGVHT